jgi:uncharacterized protein
MHSRNGSDMAGGAGENDGDLVKDPRFPFAFDPKACVACPGRCCTGESGYIWVGKGAILEIAAYLNLPADRFIAAYLKKVDYRYSILERRIGGDYACFFFDRDRMQCLIYPVRPQQCRSYPFWNCFKDGPALLARECPGIVFGSV